MRLTLPTAAAVLVLGACSPQPVSFPVPPPLPAETIPLPPVSEQPLVWQPGDWVYFGGSYRYEPGHFVPVAGHGTSWTFGHWVGTQGSYGWVPGGWSPGGA